MNKMGRRAYIRFVANALVEEYGLTLMEYGTDVNLATKVVDKLTPYLHFAPEEADLNKKEFNKWKEKREEFIDEDFEEVM